VRLLGGRTFRIEAAVIALACISVVALALMLVQDAVTQTEGTLKAAAERELAGAAEELKAQYEERAAFSERPLEMLPLEAQDLSLRGLSQTVLRSYKDVQGGFYIPESQSVVGAAGSRDTVSEDELQAIRAAVRVSGTPGRLSYATTLDEGDLLIANAIPTSDKQYAWALRRLIGVRDPAPNRRRWMLATLVIAALAGVTGVVSILIRLRRGVEGVKHTLQQLESDFTYRATSGEDDFGDIYVAIGKMADKRLELETSLRRQDRMAALGKVVAGVAHEIRNPLNSIRLQLELLKRKTQKGMASAAEVDAAMSQVDRLNTILSQLLGFGKPDVTNHTIQRVLPLAERSIAMVQDRAYARRVELRMIADGSGDARVTVDGLQIEQVLTNLLLNAVEASAENTEVSVRIAESEGTVEVAVSDRGCGIPESIREHVFDAFFTTRSEGTGLGLSVSREIVAAHGGTLSFTTSDEGTTFFVRLPSGSGE
jgi:signal transduction histidine kinase